jgi:hypothetical protein
LESYNKNSANRWQNGMVHMKMEICDLVGKKKEIFLGFITKVYGKVPDLLQACPYEVIGKIALAVGS